MRVPETCFLSIDLRLKRIDFEEIADRRDCHRELREQRDRTEYGQPAAPCAVSHASKLLNISASA